jgi:hypothetical protein
MASPRYTGASPWGAGLSSLGDALQQFLSLRLGAQEKEKDRKAHADESALDRQLRERQIGLEGQRVDLERQGQRTNEAQIARNNVQGGVIDDPELAARLESVFKGTPFEATLSNKNTLPSTQMAGSGAGPGLNPWSTAETKTPSPYAFLQPTTQEDRDNLLMRMEESKNTRENAEAPMRNRLIQAQTAAANSQAQSNSPTGVAERLKLQHGFDLQEIEARIRMQHSFDKRTTFDDDMRTFVNGMRAMDSMTDEGDRTVAQTALMGLLRSMQSKYPQMTPPQGPNLPDKNDVSQLGAPPQAASGPGLMDRFLTGAGNMASSAANAVGSGISDAFTTYLPSFCPPGTPKGMVCSKDGKMKPGA